MMGIKKQSDFPDPVPVVTTKLWPATAFGHGLRLMAIERERFAIDAEYPCGRIVQCAGLGKLIDGHSTLEPWINTYEGFGPKSVACVYVLDLSANVRCADLRERASESLVVAQKSFIEFKDIHD